MLEKYALVRAFYIHANLVLYGMHFVMHAVAKLTAVSLPRRQQLSSLFLTLGFDAPFLGANDKHRRVKRLQFGLEFCFNAATAIALPRRIIPEVPVAPIGTNRKRNRRFLLSGPNTLDSERSWVHIC